MNQISLHQTTQHIVSQLIRAFVIDMLFCHRRSRKSFPRTYHTRCSRRMHKTSVSWVLTSKKVRKCKDTYWRTPLHTLSNNIDRFYDEIYSILSPSSSRLMLSIKSLNYHYACELHEVLYFFHAPTYMIQENFRKNYVRKINSQTLTSCETRKDSLICSDPSSDTNSLASTHKDLYSSFFFNYGDPFLLSESSSSFAPNLSIIKIDFEAPSFEKILSTVTSDLTSVRRSNFEEHFLTFEPRGISFDIEI